MTVNRPEVTPLDRLLDDPFNAIAAGVLVAILRRAETGLLARRLDDLDAEAARVDRVSADNPVLRALLADTVRILRQHAALIDATAPDLQLAATTAAQTVARSTTLAGLTDAQLRVLGIVWNTPETDVLAQVADYTGREAWVRQLEQYVTDSATVINNAAFQGIAAGKNPLAIARDIRAAVQAFPAFQANNLMRTLHMTAFRDVTAAIHVANADILEGVMRIATLDARCCLACIAQHGDVYPVGTRVDDHHQGRCIGVGIVRGRPREVESGIDWFARQPDDIRRELAGGANYNALEAGAVTLRDFVQPYTDDTFGNMIREASLKGILGDGAERFYQRNQ